VGLTGLALLALMAQGNTSTVGPQSEFVARAVQYLLAQQDPDTGIIGARDAKGFLYNHAIATEALAEAALFDPAIVPAVGKAVETILAARNPNAAWRYALPPEGDNDTSITTWMVTALACAERAGVTVDERAFAGARWWLLEATDGAKGRIGYNARGNASARVTGVNDHYPLDLTETMTAAGLHAELILGAKFFDPAVLERSRALLYLRPPLWRADGMSNDFYYWFHGANALRGEGQRGALVWRTALEDSLIAGQRKDGHCAGSWDPIGPWGFAGGRVYATAMGALALRAPWRYTRELGRAR
jgi:hypothetical protein